VRTVFAVLCIVALFIRGDIVLAFTRVLAPRRLQEEISRGQRTLARKIFWCARVLAGMRTDFQPERGGRLPPVFLVVCNHQSLADIPVLAVTLPGNALRFVAKRRLRRMVPYVSRNLRYGRSALISRTGDLRESARQMRRLAGLAREGICPVVFPEGTRSRTGRVGGFFAGAVRIVLEECPMPVLSVALDGGYRISRAHQLFMNLRGNHYRARPLALYPAPRGKREIGELLEKIRVEITAQVAAWREEDRRARGRGSG
jgi:1-acyl-sn-glycerol-3-phosphate acyltransferase